MGVKTINLPHYHQIISNPKILLLDFEQKYEGYVASKRESKSTKWNCTSKS